MGEEIKEKILNFLNEEKGKKYSIKNLWIGLRDSNIIVSYPTVLKWITVLIGERRVSVEDYGNIKLVFIKKDG